MRPSAPTLSFLALIVCTALAAAIVGVSGISSEGSSTPPDDDETPPAPGQVDDTFGSAGAYGLRSGIAEIAEPGNQVAAHVVPLDGGASLVVGVTNVDSIDKLLLRRLTSDGELDTSFGKGGVADAEMGSGVAGELGNGAPESTLPRTPLIAEPLVQPDGKIVVAATAFLVKRSVLQIAVARFTSDGALDTSFGTSTSPGLTYVRWSTQTDPSPVPGSVLRLSGGGYAVSFDTGSRAGLLKLTAAGAPDTSFGPGGQRIAVTGSETERISESGALRASSGAVVQPVVRHAQGSRFGSTVHLVTYRPDGTFSVSRGIPSSLADIQGVVRRGGGKVALVGTGTCDGTYSSPIIEQLDSSGYSDLGFGASGMAAACSEREWRRSDSAPAEGTGVAVATRAAGGLVVGSRVSIGGRAIWLTGGGRRINSTQVPMGYPVTLGRYGAAINDVAAQSDGKVLIAVPGATRAGGGYPNGWDVHVQRVLG